MEKTITISSNEYERLKNIEREANYNKENDEILNQFKEGLEDLKAGRVRKVA
jgi:hypothetical protein